MNAMRKLQTVYFLLVVAVGLFSCSDSDDDGYTGNNLIYITTDGDPVMIESDSTVLKADLSLTRSYEKSVTFELVVKNTTNDMGDLVTLTPVSVTVPAGEKNVSFEIRSNRKEVLKEDVYLEVNVKQPYPATDMEVKQTLSIRFKPGLRTPELTAEQKALLEGYRQQGLDLEKWIGVIPVKVKVVVPATEALEELTNGMTKEYSGKTVITLSELATAGQPILKMTENPMGLTEFLYWLLKEETVDNDEYWYGEFAGPYYKIMMDLIGLSKTSQETFNVSLDNIRVGMPENNKAQLAFIGEVTDYMDETRTAVPLAYDYSAWNRMKEKLDANDQTALECVANGVIIDPAYYLFTSSIDEDEWDDGNWKEPKGEWDVNGNKLTFSFCFDHSSAGGYSNITVEYTLPE